MSLSIVRMRRRGWLTLAPRVLPAPCGRGSPPRRRESQRLMEGWTSPNESRMTPRLSEGERQGYRKWSWFVTGLAIVPALMWAAFVLPAYSHPAHAVQTCTIRCSTAPASQFYAFLDVATGTLLGLSALLIGLGVMARRIASGRMSSSWTFFGGRR
jgi:hypothetical protein